MSADNKLLYRKEYEDDHLKKAAASYLSWQNILGTLERCLEANKLLIKLASNKYPVI